MYSADIQVQYKVGNVTYNRALENPPQFRFEGGATVVESEDQRNILIRRPCQFPQIDAFREACAMENQKRPFLVFPILQRNEFENGKMISQYAFASENPGAKARDEYRSLTRAVSGPKFPIPQRIVAGIHLAESVGTLERLFKGCRRAIHPDSFLMNITTGDAFCLPDYWLENFSDDREIGCYLPPEWHNGNREALSAPEAARHFLAVAEFRLLCADNPFESVDTLIKYPCLTRETRKQIYGSDARFLFSDSKKRANNALTSRAAFRWNAYPGYLKKLFLRSLSDGIQDPKKRVQEEEWLKAFQKLRDCMTVKDKEFRFLDPDTLRFTSDGTPFDGLILKIDSDYQIPVNPQKAVYCYHAGLPWSVAERGMIGAILPHPKYPSALMLQNRCSLPWQVKNERGEWNPLPPNKTIPLTKGTALSLPSGSGQGVRATVVSAADYSGGRSEAN